MRGSAARPPGKAIHRSRESPPPWFCLLFRAPSGGRRSPRGSAMPDRPRRRRQQKRQRTRTRKEGLGKASWTRRGGGRKWPDRVHGREREFNFLLLGVPATTHAPF